MSGAVRVALAAGAIVGAAMVLDSLYAGDAAAQAAEGSGGGAANAGTSTTDFSDRRRRWRRSSHRDSPIELPREKPPQQPAESRCDAREVVKVDWDFIERVIIPIGDQRQHLTELKAVVAQADAKIVLSCAIEARLTPTGRLDAMEKRLEMRLEALKSMRAPLEAFYSALDDEQKARFVSVTAQSGSARAFSGPGAEASDTLQEPRSRRR